MLIEAARRAEAAVKEMLAVANDGSATTDEFRDALGISKSIVGISSAFQVSAAGVVAGRERHGDGGAEVLAASAGLSRHDARGQVKAAQVLEAAPVLRDALEQGRVSAANARRLADAVEQTSAADVEADAELLSKAESMRPEQFARESRRWTVDRQGDGGESAHRRQRARRCVRVWNGDDGMVNLRGEFDAVAGRRIVNRIEAEARRLYKTDKDNSSAGDGVGEGGSGRRSFAQCMADALDNLTSDNASSGAGAGAGRPFADICVVAHVDDETGDLVAELPDGSRLPQAVLDELACHARITGVLYGTDGTAIWRGHTKRTATEAQRQLLIAKYGGCFHCGAHPAMCQCHHITEFSKGGPTDINNMVLTCWNCHQKVHHHNWKIRTGPDGNHTLHPPDNRHYGPAHAPEPPPAPTWPAARRTRRMNGPGPASQPRPRPRNAQAPPLGPDGSRGSPDPLTRSGTSTPRSSPTGAGSRGSPDPPTLFGSERGRAPNPTRPPDRPSPSPVRSESAAGSVRPGPAAARAALRKAREF